MSDGIKLGLQSLEEISEFLIKITLGQYIYFSLGRGEKYKILVKYSIGCGNPIHAIFKYHNKMWGYAVRIQKSGNSPNPQELQEAINLLLIQEVNMS